MLHFEIVISNQTKQQLQNNLKAAQRAGNLPTCKRIMAIDHHHYIWYKVPFGPACGISFVPPARTLWSWAACSFPVRHGGWRFVINGLAGMTNDWAATCNNSSATADFWSCLEYVCRIWPVRRWQRRLAFFLEIGSKLINYYHGCVILC